jgi:hypothetical protein
MRRLIPIVLVAAGCGIGSYSDFRDQLATRWCERQVSCGEIGATEAQQRCSLPAPLLLTIRGAVDVPTAIAAHRMIFHPDNAAECLDAVKHAPCDPAQASEDFVRHCHGIVTAGVDRGGVCWGDDECVGGLCVAPDCGGTCTAYASPGGACVATGGTADVTCDPSVQFCSGDGTCFRKETQGGPCAADDQCLFGFVCTVGICDNPPRVAQGNPCDGTIPCADGTFCADGQVCLPLIGAGEACGQPDACQTGMTCVAGTCTPWLEVGGACATTAANSACPATQTCTAGACAPVAGDKVGPLAHCATDADCADGLYCASGNYCFYVGGINAVCQSDHECAKDLQCLKGACHTPGYIMCAPQ